MTTLHDILEANRGDFIFADYQRPYIWGRTHVGKPDAVSTLTDNLIETYLSGRDYFLHGITVAERPEGLEVVDGQQRLTYLLLALRRTGFKGRFRFNYNHRPKAQAFIDSIVQGCDYMMAETEEDDQDVYYFKRTVEIISERLDTSHIDENDFRKFLLNRVWLIIVHLPKNESPATVFKMMNGAKSTMNAADVIKASILSAAARSDSPCLPEAGEWDSWLRWWNRRDVREYYGITTGSPLDLIIRLTLRRRKDAGLSRHVTYSEYRSAFPQDKDELKFYRRLRTIHHRIVEAYENPTTYNRIRAILLLQNNRGDSEFLHLYFAERAIDEEELERFYKLSFLGMSVKEIMRNESPAERFEELMANLSMADVYHSDARRDVYFQLLRMNIDEDIKLGRKFDFSIWNNRSLEHIYSKSKVWHVSQDGKIRDGNDSIINIRRNAIERDRTFLSRGEIVNHDGAQLSEHCIGNLVLLYGQNNSSFGNSTFEQKKQMFLSPDNRSVFLSRNLLHSVCVFAGNTWGSREIIDNYNRTLKSLKLYYGYK